MSCVIRTESNSLRESVVNEQSCERKAVTPYPTVLLPAMTLCFLSVVRLVVAAFALAVSTAEAATEVQESLQEKCRQLHKTLAGEGSKKLLAQPWYPALAQKCAAEEAAFEELDGLTPGKLAEKCSWLQGIEASAQKMRNEPHPLNSFFWYPALRQACGKEAFEEKLESLSAEGLAKRCNWITVAANNGRLHWMMKQTWFAALAEVCGDKEHMEMRNLRGSERPALYN
eukprot:TRINITY_DN94797_c0_g1_i1.p1 TRINITY_DN94797_c0_g1~~TRINITY_DN94797_c0_g1_i1.p1  ORF type:complete len:228 (-),score=55.04 TRINITY_DN94797_c0_g1_i1:712-1395(-)